MKCRFVMIALVMLSGVLIPSRAAWSAIIINEVMSNEPGANTSLEWIELHNNSLNQGFINSHWMIVGSDSIAFPGILRLSPDEYFIVCRKLIGDLNSPGFESVWGDSSGVWGDTPFEASLQTPLEAKFSLVNTGGRIELYDAFNFLVSELDWTQPGGDNTSWEREFPDSGTIVQSVALSGSTPGIVNSVSPVGNDLSLERIDVIPVDGSTSIVFHAVSRGLTTVSGAKLYLFKEMADTTLPPSDTIDVLNLPDALPGFVTLIGGTYLLNGIYENLQAVLTDDDRPGNNKRSFVATGSGFPPLRLNEFLPNPQAPLSSEWVELKSIANFPFDINGWQIGDALNLKIITGSTAIVSPDEYIVIAEDSNSFLNHYSLYSGQLMQPSGWSVLNNTGDIVRIVDKFGFVVDSQVFTKTYPDNYTWSLAEIGDNAGMWGRADVSGGSPGDLNSVVFSFLGEVVNLIVDPTHFSPDGDGFQDAVTLTVEAPEADSYTLKIFDRYGREVRTLLDEEQFISSKYSWDGLTNAGVRLPIGMYIVYFEAAGVRDIKKPVVIAR